MDSYALCPCGSGKKVKFCCQAILPDMAKIERLQENNQPRMALQLIDKLRKDHPENAWLATQRAMALMNEGDAAAARDTLVGLLRQQPDHPAGNGLLALVILELEPLEKARKVVHRAFLKCMQHEPRLAVLLAKRMALNYLEEGRPLAARQHSAVVLRLEPEADHPQTMSLFMELDGDHRVPFPLRGPQPLPTYEPSAANQPAYRKAQRLFTHACFSEAADQLEQLAASEPPHASLQHQIALFRAWDGDDDRSAAAFRAASRLSADFDRAVELETMAQLLELAPAGIENQKVSASWKTEGLSRLLTRLDNDDRFVRVEKSPEDTDIAAVYHILDRPLPLDGDWKTLTLEQCPRAVGDLTLVDAEGDDPAMAVTRSVNPRLYEECERAFAAAAGELARRNPEDGDLPTPARWSQWAVLASQLDDPIVLPPDLEAEHANRLTSASLLRKVDPNWINLKQPALDGKSPAEAAGVESLRAPLAAAVNVLDAILEWRGAFWEGRDELCARLQLPAPQPLTGAPLRDFINVQIPRVLRSDLSQVSNEDFLRMLERSLVVRHKSLSLAMADEYLDRRTALHAAHPERTETTYLLAAQLNFAARRKQQAENWLARGSASLREQGASFEKLLTWKLRELSLRSRQPDPAALRELLNELWSQYGAKVPQLRDELNEFVTRLGIEAPWASAILTPETVGAGAGVWSADPQPAAGGEKKLWLPD